MVRMNKIIFLLFFIVALLLTASIVFAAEKVTFVVNGQESNISFNCNAIIATSAYQYKAFFEGSEIGLTGSLLPGDYLAVIKLKQLSFPPILPYMVEFTVSAEQENIVEVELKSVSDPMKMAPQLMKLEEFAARVQGLPEGIDIMAIDDMGSLLGETDMEDIVVDETIEENDTIELPGEADLGIKLRVNSELIVKVKKGKVKVINNDGEPMLKQALYEMGYSYAGEYLGEMGCVVNAGQTKKFANVLPVVY